MAKRIDYKLALWIPVFFLFFYDTSFKFFPTLFSGRKIAFIIFMIIFFYKNWNNMEKVKASIRRIKPIIIASFLSVFLILINLVIRFKTVNVQGAQLTTNIYYIVFFCFSLIFLKNIFDSDVYIMKIVSYSHCFQALFVYMALLFPNFRNFVQEVLHQLGNLPLNTDKRIIGFSNTGGASVSLLLFMGLAAIGYLIIKNQDNIKKLFLMYLFILGATFFVAKTGFYFGLLLMLVVLLQYSFIEKVSFKKIFLYFFIFIVIFLCSSYIIYLISPDTVNKTAKLSLSFLKYGLKDPSIINFINMKFPIKGLDLILGTGIFRGITNTGIILQHDSGYIRSLFSMGLIMSLIFYGSHFYVMLKQNSGNNFHTKLYIWIIFIFVLIFEIKEPFFFKDYLQLIPLLLALYSGKESGCSEAVN